MIDISLIEECRSGNFSNFRKLVELSSPYAYTVAFRMLGDADQAKDMVQETMVTVWQKLGKIKTAEVYMTWMYRIVVNKCYDELRKRKRAMEAVADEKTWQLIASRLAEGPAATLENNEMTKVLKLLTEKLSRKQKAVFILSDIEGMTNDQVSEILEMSKSSVKANLYHARKYIAGMIEKYI